MISISIIIMTIINIVILTILTIHTGVVRVIAILCFILVFPCLLGDLFTSSTVVMNVAVFDIVTLIMIIAVVGAAVALVISEATQMPISTKKEISATDVTFEAQNRDLCDSCHSRRNKISWLVASHSILSACAGHTPCSAFESYWAMCVPRTTW